MMEVDAERILILTGWSSVSAEYLAAAAALYGHAVGTAAEVDILGVSQAELAAVLEAQGARYARVEILGVGLEVNLGKLAVVLKSLKAAGVHVRWWSRMAMPDAAARELKKADADFGAVVVRERADTLLDVVVAGNGGPAVAKSVLARLRLVAKTPPKGLKDLADPAKAEPQEIWFALFQAAGFAHRDHRDEQACGDVVRALWRNEPVKPALSPRFQVLMDDYRAGYMSEIVGRSASTKELRVQLDQAAAYEQANVLVLGETGTGKQVVAQYIHDHSVRKGRRFVHHNCAYAGSDDMLLDRLFGHVKGAFTGADKNTTGLFDDADGGTLFLDEIGEAKSGVQAMLLTVLETGSFVRVGGKEDERVRVNVRLVCATNRNLQEMVLRNEFRLDLYERLCDFPVLLVPLRERLEDIYDLALHYWLQMTGRRPTKQQVSDLKEYDYPGNVRELIALFKRAWATCPVSKDGRKQPDKVDFREILDKHRIFNATLIRGLRGRTAEPEAAPQDGCPDMPMPTGPEAVPAASWPDSAGEVMHLHAKKILEKHGGTVAPAARAAGLAVNTFKKYLAWTPPAGGTAK